MKYQTVSLTIGGALCGNMWMPDSMGTLQYRADIEARIARFSDPSNVTMRDALLHELMECGGDFQNAQFTADTNIRIERKAKGGRTHVRYVPVALWRDCADLVNTDIYSNDFCEE